MESLRISPSKGKYDYTITHRVRCIVQEEIESTFAISLNVHEYNLSRRSSKWFLHKARIHSTDNVYAVKKRKSAKTCITRNYCLNTYIVTYLFLHFHWIIDENLLRLLTFVFKLYTRAWLSFFFAFVVYTYLLTFMQLVKTNDYDFPRWYEKSPNYRFLILYLKLWPNDISK